MAEYIEKQALIDAINADGNLGAYAEYIINRVPAKDQTVIGIVPTAAQRWTVKHED